jgi:hypothetical protein
MLKYHAMISDKIMLTVCLKDMYIFREDICSRWKLLIILAKIKFFIIERLLKIVREFNFENYALLNELQYF